MTTFRRLLSSPKITGTVCTFKYEDDTVTYNLFPQSSTMNNIIVKLMRLDYTNEPVYIRIGPNWSYMVKKHERMTRIFMDIAKSIPENLLVKQMESLSNTNSGYIFIRYFIIFGDAKPKKKGYMVGLFYLTDTPGCLFMSVHDTHDHFTSSNTGTIKISRANQIYGPPILDTFECQNTDINDTPPLYATYIIEGWQYMGDLTKKEYLTILDSPSENLPESSLTTITPNESTSTTD